MNFNHLLRKFKGLLKSAVRAGLALLGLELRRLPAAQHKVASYVTKEELSLIKKRIFKFFASRTDWEYWPPTPELAIAYLSEERLNSYYHIIEVCRSAGVSFAGLSIADIGCCFGYLLHIIHRDHLPSRVTGYDAYQGFIEFSRYLCPEGKFVKHNIIDGPAQSHDVVFCTQVLEHIVKPNKAISHLLSMISSGGTLIVTVPDGRRNTLDALNPEADGTSYAGHINFWSPESWESYIEDMATGFDWKSGNAGNFLFAIVTDKTNEKKNND